MSLYLYAVSLGPDFAEPLALALVGHFINDKNIHRGLLLVDEVIDADNNFFLLFGSAGELIRRFLELALRISALNGREHATHGVDAIKVFETAGLHLVRQCFQKIGAPERIDG